VHVRCEHGEAPGDVALLQRAIESKLRDKLIFRARVELVPPGTLPRYEYKAKLVREVYKEAATRSPD